MSGLFPDETCPRSQNQWGTHEDAWYEDEGCRWCGTAEPNLVVIDVPDRQALARIEDSEALSQLTHNKCPECGGGGKVQPPHWHEYDDLDPRTWDDCTRCGGTGLLTHNDEDNG